MKTGNLAIPALLAAFGLMAAVPALGASAATVSAAAVRQASDDPFSGIWAPEVLERLVEGPREALRKGGFAQAERQVEAMLARAPDAAERGRIMTAWALALMNQDFDHGRALPWMRRAAGEARQAYPRDSRLLAMSLGDYGTYEIIERGPLTSPEAEAALVEANEIQKRILGPGHVETLSTGVSLGRLRGLPERTQGDPAWIAAASRLFEPLLTADRPDEPGELDQFYLDWVDMLISNGQPDAACAVLQKAATVAGRLRLDMVFVRFQTGLKLGDAGFDEHAEPLVFESISPPKAGGCGG